jgi:hypothetical protein
LSRKHKKRSNFCHSFFAILVTLPGFKPGTF